MISNDWTVNTDTCIMCGATGYQHHVGCVHLVTLPMDEPVAVTTHSIGHWGDADHAGVTAYKFIVDRNPKFTAQLQQMADLHTKKNHDYANSTNPYSNFEEAAASSGVTIEQVFLTLIGIKLARLRELTASGKTPNNESIQDTRMDLAMYATLLASYFNEVGG